MRQSSLTLNRSWATDPEHPASKKQTTRRGLLSFFQIGKLTFWIYSRGPGAQMRSRWGPQPAMGWASWPVSCP
jgi:hypothetical protein